MGTRVAGAGRGYVDEVVRIVLLLPCASSRCCATSCDYHQTALVFERRPRDVQCFVSAIARDDPQSTRPSPSAAMSPRRGAWLADERVAATIVVLWVVVQYGWTLGFGFSNDDYIWIAGVRLTAGQPWWRVAFVSPAFGRTFVRPLVQLSFFINQACCGTAPMGYHLLNVVLHAINTLLVWRVAGRVLQRPVDGLLVALLFAIEPAHPDAVTWISGRTELLAAMFYLAAVLAHLRERTWLAGLWFALALLSKESALSFPLVAFLLDALLPARPRWRPTALAVYAAECVAYATLRWYATTFPFAGLLVWPALRSGNALAVVQIVGHRLAQAARMLWAPRLLDGPHAVVVAVAVGVVCLWVTRRPTPRRATLLAMAWIAATLLPFVGLWIFQARYVYLASIGLAMLLVHTLRVAWDTVRWPRWGRPVLAAAGVALCAGWTVAVLLHNEQSRRNGILSDRLIDAAVLAVPHAAPSTLFLMHNLTLVSMGGDPWAHTPVLLFGFSEALQLRYGDPTIEVRMVEVAGAQPLSPGRPVVHLRWNSTTGAFEPLPPVGAS